MTLELKPAIQRAVDFLDDTSCCFKEERWGNAANRAYYCMFACVRTFLFREDVYAKTHAGVKQKFVELFVKTGKVPAEYVDMLETAFEKRQSADYDLASEISEAEAVELFENAKKFLQFTQDYFTDILN